MNEEGWVTISEFPNYLISNLGNIYNRKYDQMMAISINNFGHAKITLTTEDGTRHTRSVAQLVADAFVIPPNDNCDCIILLDGDLSHVSADNLAWRPRGFAWKYARQLRTHQPIHYRNLIVVNVLDDVHYSCVVDAGMNEGLLFEDIWRSTYTGIKVYPTGSIFEVFKRV